jgi:hypothetical protein
MDCRRLFFLSLLSLHVIPEGNLLLLLSSLPPSHKNLGAPSIAHFAMGGM